MIDLRQHIAAVPDFPQSGILFRDIMPLLKARFEPTIAALDELLTDHEWAQIEAIAGIESRGFILGAALALRRGKGFIQMQPGAGRVLIVDVVVATGGTFNAAAELCAKSGYSVCGLIALIDLKLIPGLCWKGLKLRTALTYD